MSNCGNCGGCTGCGGCSGCSSTLELAPGEILVLRALAEIPFLPIARRADAEAPTCLEVPELTARESELVLLCLEKRGLISIDYDSELRGFDYSAYVNLPVRGSIALTARGQQVVELMEVVGCQ